MDVTLHFGQTYVETKLALKTVTVVQKEQKEIRVSHGSVAYIPV
jgi:hypothetical protein